MVFKRKASNSPAPKDEDAERGYSVTDPNHELNQRGPKESAQAYNQRVPISYQPILPNPTVSYRGGKINS